jgi:hypothetical protein
MSEQPPQAEPSDPQDFLGDLETPVYDIIEKGADQSGIEHRDVQPDK